MKAIFLFLLFVLPLTLWSQPQRVGCVEYPATPVSKNDSAFICSLPEEEAEFPGGMAALKEYLRTNLIYPEKAKELGIEGKCYLRFIVSSTGKITDVAVARGVPECPECDLEAIRLVKEMPDWKPGKHLGKPVDMVYNLPIRFEIPTEENKQ